MSIMIVMFSLVAVLSGGFLLSGCGSKNNTRNTNTDEPTSSDAYSGFWADDDYFSDGASDFEWYVDDTGFYVQIDRACELAKLTYLINKGATVSGTYNGTTYSYSQAAANIQLAADIDLSETFQGSQRYWTPIGLGTSFSGTFNGNYHTIRGLRCYVDSSNYTKYLNGSYAYVALFGRGSGATIKNFIVEDPYIYAGSFAYSAGEYKQAVVIGSASSTRIINVGVVVKTTATFDNRFTNVGAYQHFIGAIAGYSNSNIANCFVQGLTMFKYGATSTGNFSYGNWGGIVGGANSAIISDCYYYGHIDVYSFGNVGGIVGKLYGSGYVTNSYYYDTGRAWLGCYRAGGIVGCQYGTSYVISCFFAQANSSTLTVNSNSSVSITYIGGIIGYRSEGYTYCCRYYSSSATTSGNYAGGTSSGNGTFSSMANITTNYASSFFTSSYYMAGTNGYSWAIYNEITFGEITSALSSKTWIRIYNRQSQFPMLAWYTRLGRSQILTYSTDGGVITTTPKKELYVQKDWTAYSRAGNVSASYSYGTNTHNITITPKDGYEIIGTEVYLPDLSKNYKVTFSYTSPTYTNDGSYLEMHIATLKPRNGWNQTTNERIYTNNILSGQTSETSVSRTIYASTLKSYLSNITNNTIYIYFNAGHMTDGQGSKSFTFKNFKVELYDSSNYTQVVQEGNPYGALATPTKTGYDLVGQYHESYHTSFSLTAGSTSTHTYKQAMQLTPGTTYTICIGTARLDSYTTSSPATQFTTLFYDLTSGAQKNHASSVNSFGTNVTYTMTCPSTATSSSYLQMLIYSGLAGSTNGNVTSYTNVSVWNQNTSTGSPTTTALVTKTACHTIFSKWQLKTYTVSFSGNGYTGGTVPSSVTKTYGIDLTISANSLTRTGYTANGWNTTSTIDATADYTTTYTANAAATLYANWTPNPTTAYFRFMIESDIGLNTYSYITAPTGGYSISLSYYSTTRSGTGTTYETTTFSVSTSKTVRQSSYISVNKSNISCPAGYEFVGATWSSSASSSMTWSSSPSASYSFQASTTNGGSRYFYFFFKKISRNQLKYDPIDQYFYFEDGEFPQTAVRTYDTAFETVLRGVDLDSLNSYTSVNGQTLYLLEWDGSTTGYDSYIGQRFAGYIPSTTKTITLTEPQRMSYTFTAGTVYWFRFDPIRWRVSDYGASSTQYPSYWSYYGAGREYNGTTTNGVAVSDVLWYDKLEGDDSITAGSNADQFDIVKNLKNLFDGDYGFEYSAGNAIHDRDAYNLSTSGTNQKVSTSNVTGTDVQARYIRLTSNGSTANTANHLTKVQYKVGTTIYTLINADTSTTCTVTSGSLSLTSGTYPYYNTGKTITLDIGSVKNITGINIRRYYADKRSYYGQKIEISTDNANWTTYWDSKNTGSYSSADSTNLYAESADGRWFYNSLSPRVASLQEVKIHQKNISSYGSDLACVMAGANQNVAMEYWTRDLGQTVGNGTYVTGSGQIITSSGYDQAKGIRFATSFGEASRSGAISTGYTPYTYTGTALPNKMAYSTAATHRWVPSSTGNYGGTVFRVGDIIKFEITYSSAAAIAGIDVNDVLTTYQIIGNKVILNYKIKSSNYIGTYSFIDINFNKSTLTEANYNALTYTVNSYVLYRPQ